MENSVWNNDNNAQPEQKDANSSMKSKKQMVQFNNTDNRQMNNNTKVDSVMQNVSNASTGFSSGIKREMTSTSSQSSSEKTMCYI